MLGFRYAQRLALKPLVLISNITNNMIANKSFANNMIANNIRLNKVIRLGYWLGIALCAVLSISIPNDELITQVDDYCASDFNDIIRPSNGKWLDKIIERDLSINPDPNYWDWFRHEKNRKNLTSNQWVIIKKFGKFN